MQTLATHKLPFQFRINSRDRRNHSPRALALVSQVPAPTKPGHRTSLASAQFHHELGIKSLVGHLQCSGIILQWIGFSHNLQETMVFTTQRKKTKKRFPEDFGFLEVFPSTSFNQFWECSHIVLKRIYGVIDTCQVPTPWAAERLPRICYGMQLLDVHTTTLRLGNAAFHIFALPWWCLAA